jgi:hypothetical protein
MARRYRPHSQQYKKYVRHVYAESSHFSFSFDTPDDRSENRLFPLDLRPATPPSI